MILTSLFTNFVYLNIFMPFWTNHFVLCESQSIWYPVWITKNTGKPDDQNVIIGTKTYHIPSIMTDSPVQVDLLPGTTSSPNYKFPTKIAFLFLRDHQCLLEIPRKREGSIYKRRFIGIKDGVFPHPYDRNKFIICHKGKGDTVDCLEVDCPKGTNFDAADGKLKNFIKTNKVRKRNAKRTLS